MRKIFLYLRSVNKYWLITWAGIYLSFLILDIVINGSVPVTVIKYTGIVLCLVYAYEKWSKDYLLQIALGFTLLADTILVFDNTSTLGVFVFCIAQFFHLARLNSFYFNPKIFVLYLVIIILFGAFGMIWQMDLRYPLAGVYLITLIYNLIEAKIWNYTAKSTPSICALVGFTLFLCCDINVGISYFSSIGTLPAALFAPANYFAWVFYYPSQVLISNSSKKNNFKNLPQTSETML